MSMRSFTLLRPMWMRILQRTAWGQNNFFKGRKQVVTCCQGGVFGVPEKLSACPLVKQFPRRVKFLVCHRGDREVLGQPTLLAAFDDELWLAGALAGKDAEGGTLSSNKVAASIGGG
eukprot:3551525-Amphidinium_carterae.2